MGINDLIIKPLNWNTGVLTILRESDPLLRRFGECDLVRVEGSQPIQIRRQKADEIWGLVSGEAELQLTDTRPESPSYQAGQIIGLESSHPKAVLVPFGVSCRITTTSEAVFVRITTHQDGTHPGDETLLNH